MSLLPLLFLLAACGGGKSDDADNGGDSPGESGDTPNDSGDSGDDTAPVDADADGYPAPEDCDDHNAEVHPGAVEVCDPGDVDEDCSGAADNADPATTGTITVWRDADGDGWGDEASPDQACEVVDGYAAIVGDCDDADPRVNPEGTEVCDPDDQDEDCDGQVDDADEDVDPATRMTVWADGDGDGYGDAALSQEVCDASPGWVADATDCDDGRAAVNPAATELCNELDDDCDHVTDEADAADVSTWHLDDDGDGYGDPALTRVQCAQPSGYVLDATDCDDVSAGVNPGADERCDGEDDDCDGDVDEDAAVDVRTWYGDDDADGYGEASDSTVDCDPPPGYVAEAGDCDDRDETVSPAAVEACDDADTDEDCDGVADDEDGAATGKTAWYADSDGDGYGDPTLVAAACDEPSGFVANDLDCDDAAALVHPGATELCDAANADEDCDGSVDDADPSVDGASKSTWYADADRDGYGTPASTLAACDVPAGYAALSTDCDDAAASRNPGASEVCDAANTDEDCDGLADDADGSVSGATNWYADTDGDGYGLDSSSLLRCDEPAGYDAEGGDCDDGAAAVNPGAAELCSTTVDENCDGIAICDLSSENADRVFTPTAANQAVGYSVSGGDLDGDGVAELLVGAPGVSSSRGAVYVVAGGGSGDVAVTGADASVTGVSASAQIGAAPAAAFGDMDGDGSLDLAIPAPSDNTGAAYGGSLALLRGPFSGATSVSTAWATLYGDAGAYFGELVGVGDQDADGRADLLAGAGGVQRAYLFTDLATPPSSPAGATATFTGASGGWFGGEVADVGDADGDGIGDVVVSDLYADGVGAVYLFLGPYTGTIDVSAADGKRTGVSGGLAGCYLAERGGDVDGDGYAELAATDYSYSATPSTFLIPGPMTGTATIRSVSVRAYDSTSASGTFGFASANDGDFDGDGLADLALGDHYDSSSDAYAGAVYVFLGPLSGTITPADADVTIRGASYREMFGFSLAYVGPQSGPTDELLIGSWYNSTWTSYGGGAYLFSAGSL